MMEKVKKNVNEMEEAVFVIDMNEGFCEEGNLADSTIKHIVPNIVSTFFVVDVTKKLGKFQHIFFTNLLNSFKTIIFF